MNERDIFLAALEIAEPHQRAAYIDQACGADAQLRSEVQALLSAHERGPEFLETPAVAEDIAATRTLVGEASELMDDVSRPESGEAEFRHYLQPASRPGWLGKLAHYEIESILGRGAFASRRGDQADESGTGRDLTPA